MSSRNSPLQLISEASSGRRAGLSESDDECFDEQPLGLCNLCSAITIEGLVSPEGYSHATTHEVASTCATTCRICWLLLSPTILDEWRKTEAQAATQGFQHAHLTLHMERFGKDGQDGLPRSDLVAKLGWRCLDERPRPLIRTIQGDPSVLYGVLPTDICLDTASQNSLRLIRDWLQLCEQRHSCDPGPPVLTGVSTQPSRLIDVQSDDLDVRLIETPALPQGINLRYVALSHCWGPQGLPDECKTTQASRSDHLVRIKYSSLPANFRDAIQVTREFQIGYIWIDALCIIQDSPMDWEREAARMADIYSGSVVTIAIQSSSDAHGGCFVSENVPTHQPVTITNDLANGSTSTLMLYGPQAFDNRLTEGALFNRGWCLQENIMSPRIVHFTKKCLVWECRQGYCTEGGPLDLGSLSSDISQSSVGGLLRGNHGNKTSSPIPADWYMILENYSRRQLTYSSDKLPAISTVARRVAQLTGGTYLAGVWASDLVLSLAWSRQYINTTQDIQTPHCPALPLQKSSPTAQKPLPSWSWASHEFAIDYDLHSKQRPQQQSPLTLVGSNLDLSSSDPFAGVTGGTLRLKGPVGAATLVAPSLQQRDGLPRLHQRYHIKVGLGTGNRQRLSFDTTGLVLDYDTTHTQRVVLLRLYRVLEQADGLLTRDGYLVLGEVSRHATRLRTGAGPRKHMVYRRLGFWDLYTPVHYHPTEAFREWLDFKTRTITIV